MSREVLDRVKKESEEVKQFQDTLKERIDKLSDFLKDSGNTKKLDSVMLAMLDKQLFLMIKARISLELYEESLEERALIMEARLKHESKAN